MRSLICLSMTIRLPEAYKLFDAVEVRKNEGKEYPRCYQDYTVELHKDKIPESVEVMRMI